ncbi:hypothetical protein HNV10_02730 [Winogradskyella litoriviva]|uniref:Uncharacterized protein n=1 Tax=Winogradskyella litoriviva TaxID=1220182 RepID=A0ABX2E0W5_9FLAO|nr:hypothetical protein [Winogradskyella litoriviva]NRD22139.1 hypothetical protein [Winogradskyella litoriviva]
MKLTESQIQELYTFTRQHFVEHYDLQTELVDHLANDIETQWQEQPKLSFENAKNKAFKKFGIFGFMDAIEQKGKAMNKRYRGYLWNELKKWFEIPQVFAIICLFLVFYLSFTSSFAIELAIAYYVIVVVWSMTKSFMLNKQFKRRKKASNKKWLLEEMIFKQAGGASLFFLSQIYNIHLLTGDFLSNSYVIILLSMAFTIIALVYYISFELIPNKAEKLLNETYPEFSL